MLFAKPEIRNVIQVLKNTCEMYDLAKKRIEMAMAVDTLALKTLGPIRLIALRAL